MRIVQKYGGTSVGTIEKIKAIAEHLIKVRKEGNEVVVVVSAMGKMTDELIKKANEITNRPDRRELDMLMSTGEQQTIALLSMALKNMGHEAVSLTGSQAGIQTTGTHTKSKIKSINNERMEKHLADGKIVIVAGFQGMNEAGDITTLGRGGSDTSAVALAGALGCQCEIYTDVDGIYTCDPRVHKGAKKIDKISYEEMMEMSNLGAGVMEVRAVELGKKFGVPIYVGRSLGEKNGTYILEKEQIMEEKLITGLSINENVLMVNLQNLYNKPQKIANIFSALGKQDVNVDMISQSQSVEDMVDISFTCPATEEDLLDKAVEIIATQNPALKISKNQDLIKVSVVGVGMISHSGVAGKLFEIFGEKNIKFYQVTTSEISISFTMDKDRKAAAVEAISEAFNI
ncbi:aspartate kinase [Ilyobacter polytropus]|uniref:Aspartokinase n=1 Tax=Ilyobacter polytropus (strain ATCC 51220 / DSM 2926 / LMG 16218 / CuHBu1) TaxID=572544 RepID=E3HCN1_ILYPC|nr:aspartate kinase [Ilyobacter polytropus]ADO84426.1 aspartate kinase [Ilyobacter polytropus DSM 2926]